MLNTKLFLVAFSAIIINCMNAGQTMNTIENNISITDSSKIPAQDTDILKNYSISELINLTNCPSDRNVLGIAIHNFCKFVCNEQELLEKFLGLKNHIDSDLFMTHNDGRIMWKFIQYAPICNEGKIIEKIKQILNINMEEQLRNKQDIEINNTLENINSKIGKIDQEISNNNDQILSIKYNLIEILRKNNITINDEGKFINSIDNVLLQGKELIKQYNNKNNSNTERLNQLLKKYNIGIKLSNNEVMNCMKNIVALMDESEKLIMKKQTLEEERNNIIKFTNDF